MTPLARGIDFLLKPFSSIYLSILGDSASVERTPGSMTEDELKTWVAVGETPGGLEKGERQMIYSIFHFGETLTARSWCRALISWRWRPIPARGGHQSADDFGAFPRTGL